MKLFNSKRISKKGDLSLSINAIVILILAITMLGLGLTFMRGLFKQIGTKVSEAVDANELVNPPTFDNPITVAPGEISLRQGENGKVTLAFMNVITAAQSSSCNLTSVTSSVTGTDKPSPVFSNSTLTMDKDQINTWAIAITTTSDTPAEVTLFTAKITCTPTGGTARDFTKDFIVTVTS